MIRSSFAVIALTCVALSGCVTLLPKENPASLYKLAVASHPLPRPAGTMPVDVLLAPVTFPREATGDRIITVTGSEIASIADARWAAPAQIMFDEAIATAFDSSPQMRLSTRGGALPSDRTLRLEVRTFEARYGAYPQGAPTVVIELKAILTSPPAKGGIREQTFSVETPAAQNRVSSIVDAYSAATGKVLDDLVGWTETATSGS